MEWRSVVGYEGLYEVSNTGLVRSLKRFATTGGILKTWTNKGGYHRLGLIKDGKRKRLCVHKIVAEAFLPNPDNKPHVDHMDTNTNNNHINNLCWTTASEQQQNKNIRGYGWHRRNGKWYAQISGGTLGSEKKHLGYFEHEEDARAAYIAAKHIYHPYWVWVKMQAKLEQRPKKIKLTIVRKNPQ